MADKTEKLIELIKQAQEKYSKDHLVIAAPGFIAKKFVAYCSMNTDLELLLEYVAALRSSPPHPIGSALTYALISLYGKCFTDATGASKPKLEPAKIFESGNPNVPTHEMLMDLRHTFIAHRGDTDSEIGIAYMLVPKAEGDEQTQMRFSQLKQVSFSTENLDKIQALLNFLIGKLKDKIQKHGQKAHDALLSMFTLEELQMMTMNNGK